MESARHAQAVFQVISATQFTVEIIAVPIVPFVHHDANVVVFQAGNVIQVLPVRIGDAANLVGKLGGVLQHGRLFLHVNVLAEVGHVVGTLGEHGLVPRADVPHRDELVLGSTFQIASVT